MAKTQSGPARCAIYARCSSDDQVHKDFATNNVQEGLNLQHVKEIGGIFVKAYSDEAVTGTNLKRPGWKKLLADAQAGMFDVVIVTYMSRLGRGKAFVIAEHELEKCGVRVEMVKEHFSNDINGYIGKNMTNVMDGMYAYQVRGWTMTKMEAMVNAGFFPGGYPPFGMKKVVADDAVHFHKPGHEPPKRLVPDSVTVPIVLRAFALFLETRSLAEVGKYLNTVTLRHWTTTSVKNLLTNEVYKGVLHFGQWRKEDAWEPIIDS